MKRKRILKNGVIFLVPLPTGGYGIGVLIRSDGKGRAYGLFFGPRVEGASDVNASCLQLKDAVLCCRFGDHGLHNGSWITIGSIPNWNTAQWPLPKFSRSHDNPSLRYVTEYDDNLNVISEDIVPVSQATNLPDDVQFGSGVVEAKLAKILS